MREKELLVVSMKKGEYTAFLNHCAAGGHKVGRHSVVRVDVRLYVHPLENTVCAEFVVCLQHYYLSVSVFQSPLSSCVVSEACTTLILVTV